MKFGKFSRGLGKCFAHRYFPICSPIGEGRKSLDNAPNLARNGRQGMPPAIDARIASVLMGKRIDKGSVGRDCKFHVAGR